MVKFSWHGFCLVWGFYMPKRFSGGFHVLEHLQILQKRVLGGLVLWSLSGFGVSSQWSWFVPWFWVARGISVMMFTSR